MIWHPNTHSAIFADYTKFCCNIKEENTMRIEKINIVNFGGLKDKSLDFSDGINIIEGPNEAGKSTIGAFIKFIFFGLSSRTDGKNISERKKYQSLVGEKACGSLEYSAAAKHYRIYREMSAAGNNKDTVIVTDLDSGEELETKEEIGKLLFGVNGDLYTQTAYIRQADGSRVDGDEVLRSIDNMLSAGDEKIDTGDTLSRLEDAENALVYKNRKGGRIADLTAKRDRTAEKLDEARVRTVNILAGEASLAEIREKNNALAAERSVYTDIITACKAKKNTERYALLDAAKAEASEAEKQLEDYKKTVSGRDYLPDEEYLTMLTDVVREREELGAALKKAEDDKKALGPDKVDEDDLYVIEKAKEEGEEEGLQTFFENCGRKSRFSRSFGVLLTVFMVLWGVLSAVCVFLPEVAETQIFGVPMVIVGLAAAGISFVMLVLAILFYIRSWRFARKADKMIEAFGVTSEDDIYAAIRSSKLRAENQVAYVDKLTAAQELCSNIKADIDRRDEYITALANKWGKTVDEDHSSQSLLNETSKVISDISALTIRLEHANDKYNSIYEVVKDIDREEAERLAAGADPEKLTEESEKDAEQKLAELDMAINALNDTARQTEIELARLEALEGDTYTLVDELTETDRSIAALNDRYKAITLAKTAVSDASSLIKSNISPILSAQAGEYMRKATENRYSSIIVSPKLSFKYGVADGSSAISPRDTDYMSEGTRDAAYLSLRLALIGYIYKKELPPLVFDEAFSRLDDRRLASMFRIINEYTSKGAQAIIFTSLKRDADIIEDITGANLIKMGY